MISWKGALNHDVLRTRRNVCLNQTRFVNVNGAKRCATESPSYAAIANSVYRQSGSDLIPTPQHRDAGRETAAHVESEIALRVWNLPLAGLFAQMLISFDHLANAGRAHRMAVADQSTARIHRNLERELPFHSFIPHLGQGSRAALRELSAFSRLGQPENFVNDNLRD